MNILSYATRDVISVSPDDSIDKAICLMEEHEVHHLVVLEGNRVIGMLSDRDVLLSTGWMLATERHFDAGSQERIVGPTEVRQIMTHTPIRATDADSARDAAALLLEFKIGALPIVREGRLEAIVSESDLIRWLPQLASPGSAAERFLDSPVYDHMRARVIFATPQACLSDIVDMLRRYRIRHVPVVQDAHLVGILSDRDVRRALGWTHVREGQQIFAGGDAPPPRLARDVMQSDVQTVGPRSRMREAIDLMLEARVHCAPVVDGTQLSGMITQSDFLKAIAHQSLL